MNKFSDWLLGWLAALASIICTAALAGPLPEAKPKPAPVRAIVKTEATPVPPVLARYMAASAFCSRPSRSAACSG